MWKETFSFCFCCRSRGNKSIRYNKSRKMWKGVVLRGKLPFRCAFSRYTHLLTEWKVNKRDEKRGAILKCCVQYLKFLCMELAWVLYNLYAQIILLSMISRFTNSFFCERLYATNPANRFVDKLSTDLCLVYSIW